LRRAAGSTRSLRLLRRVTARRSGGASRFSTVLLARSRTTTYRAATRLTGGTLLDGRSPIIRLRGGR